MKLTRAVVVGLVMMVALLPMMAKADLLQLTGTSGESAGGESIGPYAVTVNGVTTLVACDDLYIGIPMGHTWEADRLTWADLPAQDRPLYGVAYWLVDNILGHPGPHADAQWALWGLFSPAAPLPGGAAGELAWATGAYAAQTGYEGYRELVVWRPTPRGESQEMLGLAVVDTPEPATLVYVGLGLAMLVVARGMRRRERVA